MTQVDNLYVLHPPGINSAQAGANFLAHVQLLVVALRMRRGLSHEDLAAKVHMTPRKLRNLLGGNSRMSVEDAGLLFEVLGEQPLLAGPLIDDAVDYYRRQDQKLVSTAA